MRYLSIAVKSVIGLALVAFIALAALYHFGPYKGYVIHTGSMGDTIPSGSVVIDRQHEYHVGQVVTYTINGMTVTHRLVGINADGTVTTKGDANRSVDPWHAPKSNIIGGVVMAPRDLGRVVVALHSRYGMACVGLIFLFVLQCYTLPGERKEEQSAAAVA